ncbi:uncharacterized protein LOC129872480 [Solanum dulcamara]|uniref:uncharacterized protein LOC129872480 n=1 Tax=Solanum dulcamara TaxID=45834 RepID=UPI00248620EC|nr:uncharacterized protein LOC129872480 [Solanum dulcamara]
MATPKGKTSSDQQEIDLNLSLGGSYNYENPKEISMPQPFSQIIASVANNPAFQRAIKIIRSDMDNNSKDMPEIYEKRKATTPTFVPALSTMTKKNGECAIKSNTEKGKSIVLSESNGKEPLKKVKNPHNFLTLMDNSDLLRSVVLVGILIDPSGRIRDLADTYAQEMAHQKRGIDPGERRIHSSPSQRDRFPLEAHCESPVPLVPASSMLIEA